ncbi:MAG: ABC transporter permease [Patescibacteria group bacterium]
MQNISNRLSLIDLLRLSLRVFRTKPLRTFLTIFGMSFGIGTVLVLVSLGYGLQYILIGKLVATEDSLITLEVLYPSESELNITYDDLKNISAMPQVAEVSPIAEFTGEISNDKITGLVIIRIIKPNYFRLAGQLPDVGSPILELEPSTVISNAALRLTGLYQSTSTPINNALGENFSFKIFYQREGSIEVEETKTKSNLALRGIMADELQPFALLPYEFVEKEPPFYKKILVKAKDINNVESLRDELIEKGFLISARIDLVNQATKVMRIITGVLGVFGVTALIVAAVGMFNTMIVSFLERIFEIGIIKSLGATDADVRNLLLMESWMMGLLGGIGGVILGMGVGGIANFGLSTLAIRLGGKPFDLFITPSWFIVLIITSSSLIGLFAGLWPARKATYLSPKEAFLRK